MSYPPYGFVFFTVQFLIRPHNGHGRQGASRPRSLFSFYYSVGPSFFELLQSVLVWTFTPPFRSFLTSYSPSFAFQLKLSTAPCPPLRCSHPRLFFSRFGYPTLWSFICLWPHAYDLSSHCTYTDTLSTDLNNGQQTNMRNSIIISLLFSPWAFAS